MKPVLIIKLGDTLPGLSERKGDFEDWFKEPLHVASLETSVVDPCRGMRLPSPQNYSGVVLTGSHSMVTQREEWSRKTALWIPGVVQSGVPLLGVCYGHQLMADAMGGTVADNPRGLEMGTVEVRLNQSAAKDPLFNSLPQHLLVHASHSQSVITLPPDAVLLAANQWDSHHAFSIGGSAWGVQFHPEFDTLIMKAYITAFSDFLKAEGQDPDFLLERVEDTPDNAQILEKFAQLVIQRSACEA